MFLVVALILPLALACPKIEAPNCASEEEQCSGGFDVDGCSKQDFCIPFMSGIIGNYGRECSGVCPQICNENQISCEYGLNSLGCPAGNYCKEGYGVCPPVCSIECLATEKYCDMGNTEDNCWLGEYCIPEGEDCAAPAMPTTR